ncbi:MAG: bifunctional (p)ppGpp synthetase/guanosine-3',5'-bis(diphosphate) 3'-pyrophosphohydrolase [Bryobacteraceae bacterium]|nr:bifunctional (p)ppGpp synthetase/guanosine-3',5'-bis(diphosphate) 3'-pyrophosphohydrolase [Bryobacteraceae bacterium]MDW8376597.1 bifunctional (p)ppGpp synthetase/guanosine-3',5'-bis(diphosphate) 3'-pyrophosphohydrolase [Bryobacterales bacterium]
MSPDAASVDPARPTTAPLEARLLIDVAPLAPGEVAPWLVAEVAEAYERLERKVRAVPRPAEDFAALRKAFEHAAYWHRNSKRKNGDPYILHPIAVAEILAEDSLDLVCLQTALLHDVVEDEKVKIEDVRRIFGEEVARCVDGVTKLGRLKHANREERQVESLRKMLLAMTKDLRVIIVKFADRLHNLYTLEALPRDRQERIAAETLEIYVPIAHRLGMGKIRVKLEDLAFQYLDPDAYHSIVEQLERRRTHSEEILQQIQATVKQKLERENIPARVEGRLKRPYSIFQKMKRQKISMDQVYDLLAIRIITDSVRNCYAALGVIHNEWPPIMGRMKDFIAIPRPNLYQSLHTSVVGPEGQSFEVQIRTEQMHRIAEEGIAAHWKYKEGRREHAEDDQRIAWLRHLMEWQKEVGDPTQFLSNLKVELYSEEVYCFTPKGKVITLPRDATPVDFAYAIHSDVGHQCVGAKVNGRIVPLRSTLKNGDVVEILTQQGHEPSKDWLSFVKTSRARNKIRHAVQATERMKAIELGEKHLKREAGRLGIQLNRLADSTMQKVASEYGLSSEQDLYAALGFGRLLAQHVLHKVAPEIVTEATPPKQTPVPAAPPGADLVVKVEGVDGVLVYRAKCCNPIWGEPIVGYVTRGKGIAVHSTTCKNVTSFVYESERQIAVEWGRAGSEAFQVKLMLYTSDRPGMLHAVTSVFHDEGSNIRAVEAKPDDRRKDDSAIIDLTAEVKDKKQLERILAALRRIPGVRDVERIQ